MGGYEQLSLDAAQNEYPSFREVVRIINQMTNSLSQFNFGVIYIYNPAQRKPANPFMDYQLPETGIKRSADQDRVFPMDTVEIQRFSREYDYDVKKATIHIGPYADELARRMNALAITMANEIYFRDHAYQPENEEGRKLIAHELAHVAQYEEKRISKTTDKKELEAEAEHIEQQEEYNSDRLISISINGKRFRFPYSKMDYYAKMIADKIKAWIKEQKYCMSEEKYLHLLCNYQEWIRRGCCYE